jgi:hypothetical protein
MATRVRQRTPPVDVDATWHRDPAPAPEPTPASPDVASLWRDQALAAEKAGETSVARVAAQRWLELAPGDAEAQALVQRIADIDAAARWREEALDAERVGKVEAAHLAAQRWNDLAPGDAEASALLGRLGMAIDDERRRAALYEQAKAALSREEWALAIETLTALLEEAPAYRDAPDLLSWARKGKRGQAETERLRQVTRWRKEAQDAEQAGDLTAARRAIVQWLEMAPGDGGATVTLKRLDDALDAERNYAELYREGKQATSRSNWSAAIAALAPLVKEAPDFRNAAELLSTARKEHEREEKTRRRSEAAHWRRRAQAAEKAGQFQAARKAAKRWLEFAPGSVLAKEMLARLDKRPGPATGRPAARKKATDGLTVAQLRQLYGFTLQELNLNRQEKMSERQRSQSRAGARGNFYAGVGMALVAGLFWFALTEGALHDWTEFLAGFRGFCIWGLLFPFVGILAPLGVLGAMMLTIDGLRCKVTVTEGSLKRVGNESSHEIQVGEDKRIVPRERWKRLAVSYPGKYRVYSNEDRHLLSIEPIK